MKSPQEIPFTLYYERLPSEGQFFERSWYSTPFMRFADQVEKYWKIIVG